MARITAKRTGSRLPARILASYWEANPYEGSFLGLHRYDGRLPDFRPATVARRVAQIRRHLASLEAVKTRDGGSRNFRLEIGALQSLLLKELFSLVDAHEPSESPLVTLNPLNIVNFLLKQYAPLDRRLRGAAKLQSQIPAYLNMVRGVLSRRLAETQYETAEMVVPGIVSSYEHELPAFYPSVSPAVRRLVEGTNAIAIRDLNAFLQTLRTEYKPRVRKEFALGRRKYERLLRAEHLTKLSIERLLEVGSADLEANKKALVDAAARVDPGKSPREVMGVIALQHPTAESLIGDTQEMLEEIRAFLVSRDLVTIPSEDRPTVIETPRFYRWASAALNPPGPFERVAKEAFYYVTPVDPEWPREKAEEWLQYLNYALLRIISVHECYPGHFVHFLHMRDTVKSPVLKASLSTAFMEGWAHYCEEMMFEQGFQDHDARYHMVQLQDALLRDCRYLCSIRMHVYGWSWEDATRFFMENAFMDRLPAEREAKRGTFDPGYLNYTLGRLMIKKLRTDWMARHPEASLREFHDAFLSLGAPPLGLAREALLGRDGGPAL